MQYKTYVGNDSQQVVLVFAVQSHGIFVVGCQKDLGACPFAGLLLLVVKGFLEEFGTLLKHEFVDGRQVGGIIPYRIFHKQDGLYTRMQDVFLCIHGVFQQLDNGQDQVCIPMPAENVVNGRAILMFNTVLEFPGIVR
ncbi:MAG: hypothetical protein WC173_07035 [Bacteroidales bacterium]